jgi:hypothetical protein
VINRDQGEKRERIGEESTEGRRGDGGFEPPALSVIGTVNELTQGPKAGGGADSGFVLFLS